MAGYVFGSSFWILGRWDSPLCDGWCLFHETYNRDVCLGFGPCHGLGLSSCPWAGDPGIVCSVVDFWPWRSNFFSQFSSGPHPSESMMWTCLCEASKFDVPSLFLLYLNGLGLSFSFAIFLYWPNLWKCSTSTLLTFQNSSYNSSNVLRCSLTRWL
jgi:hypothetical protein